LEKFKSLCQGDAQIWGELGRQVSGDCRWAVPLAAARRDNSELSVDEYERLINSEPATEVALARHLDQ
jgi:hypothetical protein